MNRDPCRLETGDGVRQEHFRQKESLGQDQEGLWPFSGVTGLVRMNEAGEVGRHQTTGVRSYAGVWSLS